MCSGSHREVVRGWPAPTLPPPWLGGVCSALSPSARPLGSGALLSAFLSLTH